MIHSQRLTIWPTIILAMVNLCDTCPKVTVTMTDWYDKRPTVTLTMVHWSFTRSVVSFSNYPINTHNSSLLALQNRKDNTNLCTSVYIVLIFLFFQRLCCETCFVLNLTVFCTWPFWIFGNRKLYFCDRQCCIYQLYQF